ncbi:MAG: PepSY-associated TM helix domain-containing protein [Gemmatimonadaceae bacterium]
MHETLLKLHRWLALAVGLFLVLIALSGAALVFEGAIDRGLNASLWHVTSASDVPLSLDTLAARARAASGGPAVTAVSLSNAQDRAWVFSAAGGLQLFVNPYSGAVQGTRGADARERSLARRIHVFHETLMAGGVGHVIVGVVSILAVLLVLGGVVLWWRRRIVRVSARASWKRVLFDLHHALGICASVVLLLMAASGATIMYRALGEMIGKLDGSPPPKRASPSVPASGAQVISADSAAAIARGALAGASLMNLQLPRGGKDPVVAAMRFEEDHTPAGRSRVYIDQYTGVVLAVENTRTAALGTRINNLKRSIHTGDLFGKPTQVLWLLAALVMATQVVTGTAMWWNARRARTPTTR